MPGISIVVPVSGRPSMVSLCLQSLFASQYLPAQTEILVVAGDDAVTREVVQGCADRLRVLEVDAPYNVAAACNVGAQAARGEWLAFLDPCVSLAPNWPEPLIAYVTECSAIGAVGSKILHGDGSNVHAGIALDRELRPQLISNDLPTPHDRDGPQRLLPAVSVVGGIVSAVAFQEVNGFDVAFRGYLADVDLCLRMGRRGYEIHLCPQSVITWIGSNPTRGSKESDDQDLMLLRARWEGRVTPAGPMRIVDDGGQFSAAHRDGPSLPDAPPPLAPTPPERLQGDPDVQLGEQLRQSGKDLRVRDAPARVTDTRHRGEPSSTPPLDSAAAPHAGWREAPLGVNVLGYLTAENGLGEAARGYIDALQRAGVPTRLKDISEMSPHRSSDPSVLTSSSEHPQRVNLICANADQHFVNVDHVGASFFRDRYNIGVWFWELPRFPDAWRDRFAAYDELWAPTSFIADTLGPISPVPVVHIPPVVKTPAGGSRERGRARLGVMPGERLFLFIFDFQSYFERKNPLALLESFRLAFPNPGPNRLVIKCVNEGADSEAFTTLVARAAGMPCSIHTGYWSREEMDDLMAACDSYVSLHRSEGFGLTLAHAMSLGKPVIATHWSGNTDFMTVANSYPVRYDLIELPRTVGPYAAGDIWADPSISHAAEQMRAIAENCDGAIQRGQRAQRDMRTYYSAEAVGALIRTRLDAVRGSMERPLASERV